MGLVFQVSESLLDVFVKLLEIGLDLSFAILDGILKDRKTSRQSRYLKYYIANNRVTHQFTASLVLYGDTVPNNQFFTTGKND